jgi:hypothetical protein
MLLAPPPALPPVVRVWGLLWGILLKTIEHIVQFAASGAHDQGKTIKRMSSV